MGTSTSIPIQSHKLHANNKVISGDLVTSLMATVAQVDSEQISLIDGERCTHEVAFNEESDQRLLCSVKTDLHCDSCGEVYCPRHMYLHKRYYCVGLIVGGGVRR